MSKIDRSTELYEAGRRLMESGDIAGAVAQFHESVRIWPHFKALQLLGECLFQLGRLQEAVVPLAAATTLNRGVRAPSLLAEVFLALEQRHDAAEMVEVALQRDPRNRRALAVKGALAGGSRETPASSPGPDGNNERRAKANLDWAASHNPARPAPPPETYSRDKT